MANESAIRYARLRRWIWRCCKMQYQKNDAAWIIYRDCQLCYEERSYQSTYLMKSIEMEQAGKFALKCGAEKMKHDLLKTIVQRNLKKGSWPERENVSVAKMHAVLVAGLSSPEETYCDMIFRFSRYIIERKVKLNNFQGLLDGESIRKNSKWGNEIALWQYRILACISGPVYELLSGHPAQVGNIEFCKDARVSQRGALGPKRAWIWLGGTLGSCSCYRGEYIVMVVALVRF